MNGWRGREWVEGGGVVNGWRGCEFGGGKEGLLRMSGGREGVNGLVKREGLIANGWVRSEGLIVNRWVRKEGFIIVNWGGGGGVVNTRNSPQHIHVADVS